MSSPRLPLLAAIAAMVPAAASAQNVSFDIPAGRLGSSILLVGRQAQVSIGLSDPALAARRASAVRGRMSIEEALRRLARGNGASVIRIDARTFRLVRHAARAAKPQAPSAKPDVATAVPTASADKAEPVIVIGSRRNALMADYAGSVTIVDGDDPAFANGPKGTDALVGRLPEVTSTHLGPGRNKIFIRGMSESSFNGPTQATVGQYFDEFRVNYNAPDPDLRLFDLKRIEVLEGPQGTLYGAGALGGIVRVVPAGPDPDTTEARFSAGIASTSHGSLGGDLSAVVNLPVRRSDLAVRLTAYAVHDDGYIDDIGRGKTDVNDVRTYGARLAVRALPDQHWTVDGMLVRQRIDGDDAQYAEIDLPPLNRRSALAQRHSNDYALTGVTARRDGERRDLVLSLSHVKQRLFERYDAVAIGNPLVAYDLTTRVRLFSAEARVAGRQDNGASWVVGSALYANTSDQDRDVEFFIDRQRRNQVTSKLTEGALYGEAQFPLADWIDLTLGGRISATRLTSEGFLFTPGMPLPDSRDKVDRNAIRLLPSAAISTRRMSGTFLFARYNESFRPGGLSVGANGIGRFDSDRVRSIELGVRYGPAAVGSLHANATVGLIRWTDVQADTLDQFAEPATVNIGDARNLFVDAGVEWRPVGELKLEAGGVFVDSEITSGPARGDALPGVARFNGRLAAHYNTTLRNGAGIQFSGTARYTGKSYLGVDEFSRRAQGNWLDVGFSGQFRFDAYVVNLSGTNLLNSSASRFALGTPLLLGERQFTTPVRPRTLRLGLDIAL